MPDISINPRIRTACDFFNDLAFRDDITVEIAYPPLKNQIVTSVTRFLFSELAKYLGRGGIQGHLFRMKLFKDWFAKRNFGPDNQSSTNITGIANNATVLVVDDSRTVLVSLGKMLSLLGFKCLTALDARSGIELARNQSPDLILMDIVMPEINGFQATRILRNIPETQHIPIIIISGTKMQTEKFWGEKMGANGFLPKPLDQKSFLSMSQKLLQSAHKAAS